MEIQDPVTETILRILASNQQLNVTNGKTQNLSFFRPFFGLELHRLQTCAFFRSSTSYLYSYIPQIFNLLFVLLHSSHLQLLFFVLLPSSDLQLLIGTLTFFPFRPQTSFWIFTFFRPSTLIMDCYLVQTFSFLFGLLHSSDLQLLIWTLTFFRPSASHLDCYLLRTFSFLFGLLPVT